MDIQDYESVVATIKLMEALETGRKKWIGDLKMVYKNRLTDWFKNGMLKPR